MQGSKIQLLAVAVAAAGIFSAILGGCTVHNYPAPQSPQQSSPARPSQSPPATGAKPAPATRPTVISPRTELPVPAPAQPLTKVLPPRDTGEARTYTIKPGDNLWNIAKEVYGDGTKYQRILEANPRLNPDNMKPGTKIVIP